MLTVVRALTIATVVLVEAGLWQWRVALTGRGVKVAGAVLGTVGGGLQVTAIAQVVTHLDEPVTMFAYAIGVGAGIFAGCCLDERITRRRAATRTVASAGRDAGGCGAN
jgi:uncharacterized protein YebE (UPF0316 family)